MTTFQEPPFQSRRSVRQSEREEVSLTESAAAEAPLNLPSAPPTTGRRARTGEVSGLIEVPTTPPPLIEPPSPSDQRNGDATTTGQRAAAQPEPLDYATRGGPQVPTYGGPSFSNNPNPASSQSGDQQYRVRDFSPEGRRAAQRDTAEAPQAWGPPQGRAVQPAVPLDYHTVAGPVTPPSPSAPEPVDAAEPGSTDLPSAEQPDVASADEAAAEQAASTLAAEQQAEAGRAAAQQAAAELAAAEQEAVVQAAAEQAALQSVVAARQAADALMSASPAFARPEAPIEQTLTRRELRALRAQESQDQTAAAEPVDAGPVDAEPVDAESATSTSSAPVGDDDVTPATAGQADAGPQTEAAPQTDGAPQVVPPLVEPAAAPATASALANAIAEFETLSRAAQQKSAPASFSVPQAAPAPKTDRPVDAPAWPAVQRSEPAAWQQPEVQQPETQQAETPQPAQSLTTDDRIPTADGLSALFGGTVQNESSPDEQSPSESSPSEEPTPFDFLLKPSEPAPVEPAQSPFPLMPESAAAESGAAPDPFTAPESFTGAEPAAASEPFTAAEPAAASEPAAQAFTVPAPPTQQPEPQPFAVPAADELLPRFVEPEIAPTDESKRPTTGQTYATSTGHWSNQAQLDDGTQDFENTLSRDLGRANPTTNALVLPVTSQHTDFAASLNATGEILATGSINLPQGFGSRGGDSRRYDDPDVDHLFDAFDNEIISTDSAPVRAIRSVSTQTATRGVIHSNKPNGNRMLTVLLVAGCVMAVAVGALLVAGFVFNIF